MATDNNQFRVVGEIGFIFGDNIDEEVVTLTFEPNERRKASIVGGTPGPLLRLGGFYL